MSYRHAALASLQAQMSGKAPLMRQGAPNGTVARRDAWVMDKQFISSNPMADLTLAYADTSIADLDNTALHLELSREHELLASDHAAYLYGIADKGPYTQAMDEGQRIVEFAGTVARARACEGTLGQVASLHKCSLPGSSAEQDRR